MIHRPGREPGVVCLLHGVGLDPGLFVQVMEHISHHTGRQVVAPLREPYADRSVAPAAIMDQARSLIASLDPDRPATIVGVSGGATIALAVAIVGGPGVERVVAHEPLVGPLAAELHVAASAAADRLAATDGASGVEEFLRGLFGDDAWSSLPASARAFAVEHAPVVRAEVPQFVAFAPSLDELAAIDVPTVVTTGERSHPRRHAAAAALALTAGARTEVIAGCGHLVHRDQPEAFARLVVEHLGGDRVHGSSGSAAPTTSGGVA